MRTTSREVKLLARLEREEAARLLEWLAAGLRRGEIETESEGLEHRFHPEERLRANLQAEQRPYGGRVHVAMSWEDPDREPFNIQPD